MREAAYPARQVQSRRLFREAISWSVPVRGEAVSQSRGEGPTTRSSRVNVETAHADQQVARTSPPKQLLRLRSWSPSLRFSLFEWSARLSFSITRCHQKATRGGMIRLFAEGLEGRDLAKDGQ